MSKGWGDPEPTDEGPFVPALQFEELESKYNAVIAERTQYIDTINQLRDALTKVNAGIHKASEMAEGVVWTADQKMITEMAFFFKKHHPKRLSVRYKGELLVEFFEEEKGK